MASAWPMGPAVVSNVIYSAEKSSASIVVEGVPLKVPMGLPSRVGDAGVDKVEIQERIGRVVADELKKPFFALDIDQLMINAWRDVDESPGFRAFPRART